MNKNTIVDKQKQHLSDLLIAMARCIYFLQGSANKQQWPLQSELLKENNQNIELFESLSAVIPFSRSNDMNIVPIIVLPMFIKNLSHSHSSNGDFL